MGINTKTLAKKIGMAYDEGASAQSNAITSEAFKTEGMIGKLTMVQAEVTVEVVGAATTSTVYPKVQYSLDGVNFVDSPTAVTVSFTAGSNKVAVGSKLLFNVDLANIIAPYLRFVWRGSHSNSDTNLTAGKIKHYMTFSV